MMRVRSRHALIGMLLAAALCSCGEGVYTEIQVALVTVPFLAKTEVRLHFENRICSTTWPDEERPDSGTLWQVELDIDCQAHSVGKPVKAETLTERQEWLEYAFRITVRCSVAQVTPVTLNHCMYPKDAGIGLDGIGDHLVEVDGIHPEHRNLRVGEWCDFTFARLVWDDERERYEPLNDGWRTAPVIDAECL